MVTEIQGKTTSNETAVKAVTLQSVTYTNINHFKKSREIKLQLIHATSKPTKLCLKIQLKLKAVPATNTMLMQHSLCKHKLTRQENLKSNVMQLHGECGNANLPV